MCVYMNYLTRTILSCDRFVKQAYKAANHPLSLLNIVVWGTSSAIYLGAHLFYNLNHLVSFTLSPFAFAFILISAVEATALVFVLKCAC